MTVDQEKLTEKLLQKLKDEISVERDQKGLPPLSQRDLLQEAINRYNSRSR